MTAPDRIETTRLLLRKPRPEDGGAIFTRYSADLEVTKYVGWPVHRSVEDTQAFLAFSDEDWARWPAGPYLVESDADGALLGGTGYIFAKDAWGHGYATEALQAMVVLARDLSLRRLYAICHVDHHASANVLEKCGFTCEGILRRYGAFPNLGSGEICDVLCYAMGSGLGLSDLR